MSHNEYRRINHVKMTDSELAIYKRLSSQKKKKIGERFVAMNAYIPTLRLNTSNGSVTLARLVPHPPDFRKFVRAQLYIPMTEVEKYINDVNLPLPVNPCNVKGISTTKKVKTANNQQIKGNKRETQRRVKDINIGKLRGSQSTYIAENERKAQRVSFMSKLYPQKTTVICYPHELPEKLNKHMAVGATVFNYDGSIYNY